MQIYTFFKVDTVYKKIKLKIYQILEKSQKDDFLSYGFDIFIFTLIILNIAFTMLETLEPIEKQFSTPFNYFETLSVIIFTIEYILRLWTITCNKRYRKRIKGRIKYVFSFMALVDLFAILPFYLPFVFLVDLRFLRAMRLFRIMRILKISRYSHALGSIIRVLKKKAEDLWLTVFVVFLMLIVSSSIMYYIERDAQPETFSNIFQAFWWGIVTLTTVGYGDMLPITPVGKIIGGLISILGIGLVAIPSGILASAFQEDLSERKRGKIRKLRFDGHIVICGYNQTARVVLEKLLDDQMHTCDIILISQQKNPEFDDIVFLQGDYSDSTILHNASVRTASMCIVFAEEQLNDTNETIDMRTIFTVYNVKKENHKIHTIAELIHKNKLSMMKETVQGDEIILTEVLDSHLIAASIIHLHIFPVLNELINLEGKKLHGLTPKEIGFKEKDLSYKEILLYGIEHDMVFIGYISKKESRAFLSPEKTKMLTKTDTVIYIK